MVSSPLYMDVHDNPLTDVRVARASFATTIHCIPPEILSQIFLIYFELCQHSDSTNAFTDIILAQKAHNTIFQVCRRWHAVALADPLLWTIIPIIAYYSGILESPERRTEYQRVLQRRIQHTSALSLSLLLYYGSYTSATDPGHVITSTQTFLNLLSRAHSVFLDVSSIHETTIPTWTTFIDASELPTATLIHSAKLYLNDESFGRKLVSSMPNVEVLEIEVPGNNLCIVDGSNVGHRLQSLDLRCGRIALGCLLDVLNGAPLLQTLKVCRVAEPAGNVGHYQFGIVTHPVISFFLISSSTTADNIALFNHITLPALRILDITAADDDEAYAWPLPCNIVFIRRSGCRLKQLIVRDHVIDDRITELFSSQQELVDLQLDRPSDDTRCVETSGRTSQSRRRPRYQNSVSPFVLAFLTRWPGNNVPRPLPSLKRLRIAVESLIFFTVMTFMVQSRSGRFARQGGVAILEDVHLLVVKQRNCDVRVTEAEQRDMFKSFTDAGMRVSIAYQS